LYSGTLYEEIKITICFDRRFHKQLLEIIINKEVNLGEEMYSRIIGIILICIVFVSILEAEINFTISERIEYNDNVFELSDKDIDKFDSGDSTFKFVDTSDDMIMHTSFSAKTFTKVKKQIINYSVKMNYSQYINNSEKSKISLLTMVGHKNKKFKTSLYYGYYPGNYSRKYKDNDGTQLYEKYEYDKIMLKFKSQYRIMKNDYSGIYFKYEEYTYNQYFTEYDGSGLTYGIDWKHSFSTFYLTSYYRFKIYECDRANENTDASYEDDNYGIEFLQKKVKLGRKWSIRPFFSFAVRNRFYKTENENDEYHCSRNDTNNLLNIGSYFHISETLTMKFRYEHEYRKSSSDIKDNISDTKEYLQDGISLEIEYNFSL